MLRKFALTERSRVLIHVFIKLFLHTTDKWAVAFPKDASTDSLAFVESMDKANAPAAGLWAPAHPEKTAATCSGIDCMFYLFCTQ